MVGVVRREARQAGLFVFSAGAIAASCHAEPAAPTERVAASPSPSRASFAAPSANPTTPGPSASASAAPLPLRVAIRLPASVGQAPRRRAGGVVLGERWGCAHVSSEGKAQWQCWNAANDASGARTPPQAFAVPWLDGKSTLLAGAARLCAYEKPALTLRCWRPPQPGQAAVELDDSGEWHNPNQAPFEDIDRLDWAAQARLGGAFTCYKNPSGDVWCLGDDTFGQLARASVKPSADANRPPIIPVWPAENLALGSFHGCALAAPHGLAHGGFISCWGRGDAGQLGVSAPDVCSVDGAPVACAQKPQKGPVATDPVMFMVAGDLFTCLSDRSGVRCWGGSRDGFFGAPGSCPRSLTQSWPTLGAPVAAPRARCSQKAVALPGARDFDQDMSAGPRGLCFVSGDKLRCLGAVPTPREAFRYATVSQGQDASACSVKDGDVRCWGEAYSSPKTLALPITIALQQAPATGDVAVVGASDPAAWDDDCLVKRRCSVVPAPAPPCAADTSAHDWSELASRASSLVGQTVQVRGPLGVGSTFSTAAACVGGKGRACCNRAGGAVVLGGASQLLALDGSYCSGDESQLCCNAPAFGQTVIATGKLGTASVTSGAAYRLTDVTLCTAP